MVCLPIRGTASEVVGIMAETRFMKTVSERRTVTSEIKEELLGDNNLLFFLIVVL